MSLEIEVAVAIALATSEGKLPRPPEPAPIVRPVSPYGPEWQWDERGFWWKDGGVQLPVQSVIHVNAPQALYTSVPMIQVQQAPVRQRSAPAVMYCGPSG